MKTQIKTTGFTLTPSLEQLVNQKMMALERFLGRWEENNEVLLRVELARTTNHHRKGAVFYVELNLNLPLKVLRIEERGDDLRTVIDLAKDCLKDELNRLNEKLRPQDSNGQKTLRKLRNK